MRWPLAAGGAGSRGADGPSAVRRNVSTAAPRHASSPRDRAPASGLRARARREVTNGRTVPIDWAVPPRVPVCTTTARCCCCCRPVPFGVAGGALAVSGLTGRGEEASEDFAGGVRGGEGRARPVPVWRWLPTNLRLVGGTHASFCYGLLACVTKRLWLGLLNFAP